MVCDMIEVLTNCGGNHIAVYKIYQTNTSYTLNLHNVICQSCLNLKINKKRR